MSDAQARVEEIADKLGEPAPDQPEAVETDAPVDDGTGAPEADVKEPEAEVEADERFHDLPDIPEDADREWFARRYGEMQSAWTKKTQGLASQRKEAEQALALAEAFRNPEKHPDLLAALGY